MNILYMLSSILLVFRCLFLASPGESGVEELEFLLV
jgi:hypothetical protein